MNGSCVDKTHTWKIKLFQGGQLFWLKINNFKLNVWKCCFKKVMLYLIWKGKSACFISHLIQKSTALIMKGEEVLKFYMGWP